MHDFWQALQAAGRLSYEVKTPVVPTAALEQALVVLMEYFDSADVYYCCDNCLHDTLSEWIFRTDRGAMKVAKFLERKIRETYNIKLPTDTKSIIGNLLTDREEKQLDMVISLGCAGSAGEYYHRSSCFWGEYRGSKDYIESMGGGAVRLYLPHDRIIGRTWFVPYSGEFMTNGLIMFNAYGEGQYQHVDSWGELVADVIGAKNQRTALEFNRLGAAPFYQNNESSCFVGEVNRASSSRYRVSIDLVDPDEYRYFPDPRRACTHCGQRYPAGTMYRNYQRRDVCETCWHELYTEVTRGNYHGGFLHEDILWVTTLVRGREEIVPFYREDPYIVVADRRFWDRRHCTRDEHGEWHEPEQLSPDYSPFARVAEAVSRPSGDRFRDSTLNFIFNAWTDR